MGICVRDARSSQLFVLLIAWVCQSENGAGLHLAVKGGVLGFIADVWGAVGGWFGVQGDNWVQFWGSG